MKYFDRHLPPTHPRLYFLAFSVQNRAVSLASFYFRPREIEENDWGKHTERESSGRTLWVHAVWEVRKLTAELSRSICLFDCPLDLFFFPSVLFPPARPLLPQAADLSQLWLLYMFFQRSGKSRTCFSKGFLKFVPLLFTEEPQSLQCAYLCVCVFKIYCKTSVFVPSEMFCKI